MERNTGHVGFNTINPTAQLSVNGSANKPGGGSWAVFSDARLKKNVQPYEEGLETLAKIKPVSFQYNGKAGISDTEKRWVGVIAQDMPEAMPHTVRSVNYENEETGENGEYLEFDPSSMDFLLVNSVQELSEVVAGLKAEVERMKSENAALKAEVKAPKEN